MYDLVIIGAGPGGLAAGLYAGRSRLNTLILEKDAIGGQIAISDEIENYPGGKAGEPESGKELTDRMKAQVERFNVPIKKATVVKVDLEGKVKKLELANGETIEAKAVIVATGANPRKLNVPGEKEYTTKGVSYCATCDGDFFTDLEVFVVGARNSAVEEAMYLTKFARKVTILCRREKLRCDAIVEERAEKIDNLDVMYHTSIKEIRGHEVVDQLLLVNNETGEEWVYDADEDDGILGVFVFVGYNPNNELFKDQLELDESGYIITDEKMKTNIEGVYAIGDIRNTVLRQVITAASDGAIAACIAEKELKDLDY